MVYIDTWAWFDTKLRPLPTETYQAFMDRCVPAMIQLQPDLTEAEATALCFAGWSDYIMRAATEVTLTLKRDVYSSVYLDTWMGDWEIKEIHAATLPSITYSALEKSKTGGGQTFHIAKAKEEKQMVFGWANIAKDANGNYPLDWDGDFTEPEDLENAAYQFVLKYRATGENHEGEVKGQLVESVMLTKEKQSALGIPDGVVPEGWWVGFHVPDKEVFAKIKSGEYEMFSVQGSGIRTSVQE